ncbi:MAG: nucleotidyltransferase family protein [Acidobacteriota bacterium]
MSETGASLRFERIRQVAEVIGRETGCRLIVLFGSAARRDMATPADLDLAVLPRHRLDMVAFTNQLIQTLGVQDVDVADLSRADPLLLMLVARDGVPLYEQSPGEFARFVSLAARRYADTRKFRQMERREVVDFLARRWAAS